MSRVYVAEEEDFPGQWALWNRNMKRSLDGRKGQAALIDLETALLALPVKRLIADHLAKDGEVCAVGAVVLHRKVSLGQAREAVLRELEGEPYVPEPWTGENPKPDWWDDEPEDEEGETEEAGVAVGVPRLVAWRLVVLNDLDLEERTPEERYGRVLAWTQARIKRPPASPVVGTPERSNET